MKHKSAIEILESVMSRLDKDNIYDRNLIESVINYLKELN